MLSSRRLSPLLASLLCFSIARAQTPAAISWANLANGADFTSTLNWTGGTLFNDTSSTIAVFDSPVLLAQPVIGSPFSVAGVRFTSTTGNVTLSASGGGALTLGSWGLENQATSGIQTISAPLVLSATATAFVNQSNLLVSGNVTTTGTLNLKGLGTGGVIAGSLSGNGNLVKDETGSWTLSGTNSYSGSTSVVLGTLAVSANGALPTGGNVSLNPGAGTSATLNLGNTTQSIGSLSIAGGNGSNSLIEMNGGSLTLGGNVTYDGTGGPNGAWISGGTVVMAGNTTLAVFHSATNGNGGADLGIAANLVSSGNATTNLIKTGDGLLQLQGNATYTGATLIQGGRLRLSGNATLPANGTVVIDAATGGFVYLDLGSTTGTVVGSLTFKGAAASDNMVDLGPTGVLTLGGNVTVDSTNGPGYAQIMNGTALNLGAATRTFTIGHSGNASFDLYVSTPITGNVGLIKEGAGSLVLMGNNSYTGNTTVNAGTLQIGASNNVGTLVGSIIDNANVVFDDSGSTYAGEISGSGSLTIKNSLVLTGANTYTGGTTIAPGGTLQLGLGAAGGGGTSGMIPSGNIANNGALYAFHSDSVTIGGISGNGSLEQAGAGTLTLSGTNTYSGSTWIDAGTLADATTGTLSPHSTVFMFGGLLNITGNETIAGLGDRSMDAFRAGAPQVNVAVNTTLTLGSVGSTFSGDVTGTGRLALANGVTQTMLGNVAVTGGVSIATGGTLNIGNGSSASGALTSPVVNNGNLTFAVVGNVTASGISGSGVVNIGNGTVTLSGSDTYSGNTEISAGATLTDAAAGALSPNSRVRLNGTGAALVLNYDETIFGLGGLSASAGSTTSIAGGKTLTINESGFTYQGVISGNGSVALTGTGTQLFGGASTYIGGTTINGGTLVAANTSGSATGTGTITIATGAGLRLGNNGPGGAVTGNIANSGTVLFSSTDTTAGYAGIISGNGTLNIGGGSSATGLLNLTGANTYTGQTFVNAGTLRLGAANTLPSGTSLSLNGGTLDVAADQTLHQVSGGTVATVQLESGATLTLAPGANSNSTLEGTVAGTGALAISAGSAGSVTLTGANTYSGGTTVNTGALYVMGTSTLGTGGVNLQANTTLSAVKSTAGVTVGNNLTIANGVTLVGPGSDGVLNLNGTINLPTGGVALHLGGTTVFGGTVKAAAGTTQLTFDSTAGNFANAVFVGAFDPSLTILTANKAGIIFGSTAAAPSSGLALRGNLGYVGITAASGAAPTAGSVLALIDKANFTGTFGFDRPGGSGAVPVFSDAIDLSGFGSSLSLGSKTVALLNGTLTPSSSGYLFGNGGGALIVATPLVGANALSVNSDPSIVGNGLALILRGSNTFTGSVAVNNSALVLDAAGALPSGRAVTLGANGYLGYTEAFTDVLSFQDFVTSRIVAGGYTSSSIIGVDSNTYINNQIASGTAAGTRTLGDTIDLRLLGPVSLGTMTRATLTGQIYAPNQGGANQTLSLVAMKGGQLTISSNLPAGQVNSVVVAANASKDGGTVILTGENTYAGGTTLKGGNLVVTQTRSAGTGTYSPLGTGALTVPSGATEATLAGMGTAYLWNSLELGEALQLNFAANASGSAIPSGLSSQMLVLNGAISDQGGAGSLDLYGTVFLSGANTFSGGTTIHEGLTFAQSNAAFGSGTINLSPGLTGSSTTISLFTSGATNLANPMAYNGTRLGGVNFFGNGLTLSGGLALHNDVRLAAYELLSFTGSIFGSGRLYNVGSNSIVLSGANSYSGGTEVQSGRVIFATAGALPGSPSANALTAGSGGYIGLAYVPTAGSLQASFLDRFAKGNTFGTIGFDSASTSSPNTFADTIDLTNFGSLARLGSTSRAILTGTITPSGSTYRFGNGGGLLEVTSPLVDNAGIRSVVVISTATDALTVRLAGANTYSGGTTVTNSGVVFGTGAIPTSGSFTLSAGAYVGTEDGTFAANPTNFVQRFTAGTTGGIVGFDGLTVTGNLNLSSFTSSSDPGIYLGTSTTATLAGGIILPAAQATYRFAGYKGGQLTVQTQLTDGTAARSVVIGDSNTAATFGASGNGTLSRVTLSGSNTYSGGTFLNAGELDITSATALGTGALTVGGSTAASRQIAFATAGGSLSLSNAVVLNQNLTIDGASNLTLSGVISGSAALSKIGSGALTLSGPNTFSGGMNITAGAVTFTSGNAVGAGALNFTGSSGSTATFLDSTTINGLLGDNANDSVALTTGKTFTVSLPYESAFAGRFAGNAASFIVSGSNHTLTLSGASTFTGPVTVQGGATLVASNANALGAATNVVTVNGGNLGVSTGVTFSNPVTLTSGGIGGGGTFKSSTVGYTIGTGITLHPGLDSIGSLAFDGSLLKTSALIMDAGGTYKWRVADATNSGGWDTVNVTGTVGITSTALAPFTFSIKSVMPDGNNGLAANFDPAQMYTWTVLTATSITGLNSSGQFVIDTSGFLNPNSGTFSLGANASNTALVLTFNPVPEPSTYALMIAGLGVVGYVLRRRRR